MKRVLLATAITTIFSFSAFANPVTNLSNQNISSNGPITINAPGNLNLTNTTINTPGNLTITADNVSSNVRWGDFNTSPGDFSGNCGNCTFSTIQPNMIVGEMKVVGSATPSGALNRIGRIGRDYQPAKPIVIGGGAPHASQLANLAPSAGGDMDPGMAEMYNYANGKLNALPVNGH